MAKVLIIEDDPLLAETLMDWLQAKGYLAEVANDGGTGLLMLQEMGFDLAIVDWQLPVMSGPAICTSYRRQGGKCPILMLTQKSTVQDKAEGLDSGADDFLPKPFDLVELGARVRALLRRSTGLFESNLVLGQLVLDCSGSTITVHNRTVHLVPREFAVVEFLMRHPHTYFSTEKLLDHVWASSAEVGHEALRTCISRIRSKIDQPGKPSVIENSKGWGYKISEDYLKQ